MSVFFINNYSKNICIFTLRRRKKNHLLYKKLVQKLKLCIELAMFYFMYPFASLSGANKVVFMLTHFVWGISNIREPFKKYADTAIIYS